MEPHIPSIQRCQCGSNICNSNGNIVENIVPALLEYFQSTCSYRIMMGAHVQMTISQLLNKLVTIGKDLHRAQKEAIPSVDRMDTLL